MSLEIYSFLYSVSVKEIFLLIEHVLHLYCKTVSESTVEYSLYGDCYGRFVLYLNYMKLKFHFSLSYSTQFDFYHHQGKEHVES